MRCLTFSQGHAACLHFKYAMHFKCAMFVHFFKLDRSSVIVCHIVTHNVRIHFGCLKLVVWIAVMERVSVQVFNYFIPKCIYNGVNLKLCLKSNLVMDM